MVPLILGNSYVGLGLWGIWTRGLGISLSEPALRQQIQEPSLQVMVYSPPYVDRIWLWVYNKILIYPIFYLFKGDHEV